MQRLIHTGIAAVVSILLLQACKKTPTTTEQQPLIESARSYFDTHLGHSASLVTSNIRIAAARQPYWPAAYTINSSHGPMVIVPVFYKKNLVVTTAAAGSTAMALNYLTKLLMYRVDTGFYSQVVTTFPDSNSLSSKRGQFSGLAFVETWDGVPLIKYKVAGGITLTQAEPPQQKATPKAITTSAGRETDYLAGGCSIINGYNYSSDDPDDLYFWSEPGGCNYTFYPENPSNPYTSPSELFNIAARPPFLSGFLTIAPPTNQIANMQDYTKCFSNYGGTDHSYQVMVCVDQPVPGSRDAWALATGVGGSSSGTNPVDAGHVFLVLTETFGGYSIVRNVGFYPKANVFPWSSSAQGQLNNDDGHPYNISLSVNVDNGQFFNILNYISQGNNPGYMYDLNTNNCTSFAIHALQAGNVNDLVVI